jgi:cellulose synthase/poly-beta-1,6-N-acetylglucosamine synthase-like glycosyltransferase
MKISILIPCYNEEKSIRRSALSWLDQSRPADEIIVVDDCSKDRSAEILKEFEGRIKVVKTPKNTGNKSSAQEYGLTFVMGDIFIATDADTIMDRDFIKNIEKNFKDPNVVAVGGYIKSLKYNWLTLCRAFDYSLGQNFHKLAQSKMGFMLVIPGAAGAFRTDVFKNCLEFDHDTVTEDLDFTYKLHKQSLHIKYDRNAIVYTQDPATLHSYINQMRRWFGGGWQNLLKHFDIIVSKPSRTLELSLMYVEGLVFSVLLFLVPILNPHFALVMAIPSLFVMFLFSFFAAIKEKRVDIVLAPLPYMFLMYINSYVFIEQFIKEIILRRKNLIWFQPERVEI